MWFCLAITSENLIYNKYIIMKSNKNNIYIMYWYITNYSTSNKNMPFQIIHSLLITENGIKTNK